MIREFRRVKNETFCLTNRKDLLRSVGLTFQLSVAIALGDISMTSAAETSTPLAVKVAEFNEEQEISALEFSPDNTRLSTVEWTGSEVHVWQWEGESRIQQRLSIPEGSGLYTLQSGLKFSPSGNELAVALVAQKTDNFGVVKVFDLSTGRQIHKIIEDNRNGLKSAIDYSSDGRLFARTYDGRPNDQADQFFVYDTSSWTLLWSLHVAPFIPTAMALSPNGRFAVLGGSSIHSNQAYSELLIVDLNRRKIINRISGLPADREVQVVRWTSDSSDLVVLVSSGSDVTRPPSLFIFNSASGAAYALKQDASGDINSIAMTADGRYLIEGKERSPIAIWNSKHTLLLQNLPVQPSRLTISPDGRYLAVASISHVSIWKLQ